MNRSKIWTREKYYFDSNVYYWSENKKTSFLSNAFLTRIKYKDRFYRSAEHAYQAAKCLKKNNQEEIRKRNVSSYDAKWHGERSERKPHWNVDKIAIMEAILREKFTRLKLLNMLKETENMELIAENNQHDIFWGVCSCSEHKKSGFNMLGHILMKIRPEINYQ